MIPIIIMVASWGAYFFKFTEELIDFFTTEHIETKIIKNNPKNMVQTKVRNVSQRNIFENKDVVSRKRGEVIELW